MIDPDISKINPARNGCFIKLTPGYEKLISRHVSVAGVNALKEAHNWAPPAFAANDIFGLMVGHQSHYFHDPSSWWSLTP